MSQRSVCLALQGGGSHGAFTWGVLDRLLADDGVEIEAISGASAGAMNAVVLAYGYTVGGRDGAREALEKFWNAVSERSFSAIAQNPEPATHAYLSLTRYFSPYQLNPLNLNPLRDIISEQIDFERLRAASAMRLFISTTRVRDGALRLFTERDITGEALLASACIPSLQHSVEIEGEPYWDGGLTANPPLTALVYECSARDILVVVLSAGGAQVVPSSADAIAHRLTQIGFSSTLSTELHAIRIAKQEADRGMFGLGRVDRRLRALRLHLLDSASHLAELDPVTRFNTDSHFISELRTHGRAKAEEWLAVDPEAREPRGSAAHALAFGTRSA